MGGEQLEWLPVGWKVKVRVRSCGRKDKYYVNPSNDLKFSSKPEVLRYLKSSEKDQKPNELDKIEGKKAVAGELPPGWVKKIRTKKKGSKIRRDPYYVDPASGRHFRSMQEVFRFIESAEDDRGHVDMELGDHSQSSSGESKERRSTENKADTYLIGDQCVKSGSTHASGLKGTLVKNEITPDANHLEQREEKGSPATEVSNKLQLVNGVKKRAKRMVEIKKLTDIRVDKKSADRDQRSKSGSKVAALRKQDMPILEKRDDKEDDSVAANLSKNTPQVNMMEKVNGGRRRSMRLVDIKQKDDVTEDQTLQDDVTEGQPLQDDVTEDQPLQDDITEDQPLQDDVTEDQPLLDDVTKDQPLLDDVTEYQSLQSGTGAKLVSLPESNDLEQGDDDNNSTGEGQQTENLACRKKRKSQNSKSTRDSPCRPSKRPARLEIEHPSPEIKMEMEIKTSNKFEVSATPSGEAEVTTAKDVGKSGPSDENPTNDEKNPISQDCKEDEKHCKNLESSLEGLFMDPCFEFAVKTLTGAIPIEEVNKVGESSVSTSDVASTSSMFPSGHIWADPCFEFAVKMLTGEMPVVEDDSRFHVSLQQPLGPSFDNVNCLNYSFDVVKKPWH